MNTMRNAVAFLAALFFSVKVFAETVIPCPSFKPGDELKYQWTYPDRKTTPTLVITKVDEKTIEGRYGKRTTLMDRNLNVIIAANGLEYSPKAYRLPECPMKLGETYTYKNISYTASAGQTVRGDSTLVVGKDFVITKTALGEMRTFEVRTTFKYVWERLGGGSGAGTSTTVSQVNEEGIVVSLWTEDDATGGGRTTMELVSKTSK